MKGSASYATPLAIYPKKLKSYDKRPADKRRKLKFKKIAVNKQSYRANIIGSWLIASEILKEWPTSEVQLKILKKPDVFRKF